MKQGASVVLMAAALAVPLLWPRPASAELQVRGEGRAQLLEREQFAQADRSRYDLFAEKCTRCHAMARPIAALLSGTTPISQESFDREGIKKYVVKMMRKPNSGIDKEDAKEIIVFLTAARALQTGEGGAQ